MKKIFILLIALIVNFNLFAQTNSTVDINDDVYNILSISESRNLCSTLSYSKPYSQSYILKKLEEIKGNLENQNKIDEAKIINNYIKKFEIKDGLDKKNLTFKASSKNEKFPMSFILNNSLTGNFSSGLYKDTTQTNYAFEIYDSLNFKGDLGQNISYSAVGSLGFTMVPLNYMGDYNIGTWLYHDQTNQASIQRNIHVYHNNSFLPYRYDKFWDGSVYLLSDVSASGLEGWPTEKAFAFAMSGDIHASYCDNKIELSLGRMKREWAGMDDGSSLVLNANARPFLAFQAEFTPFEWLSFSTLTGVLEFPNQELINKDAWYDIEEEYVVDVDPITLQPLKNADGSLKIKTVYNKKIRDDDSSFFQNAFSMTMLGINTRYFHIDFGSACVWPKRFELGYAFPLIDRVVYQNNIGDFDNLSLFGNIKFTYPGFASFWFSAYLDEVNAILKSKFWEKTRAMYSFQLGTKFNIPFLPFTTASFRYTKVEPFCYTHHGINYTPWYDHYISESYTNNGQSLGYYLPPNSDEFNIEIRTTPIEYAAFGLRYQLIRHGVDWGSKGVLGSNLYSELRNVDRDDFEKFFLRDGTYEWSNIISINATYDLNKFNLPIKVFADVGFIYDWFTEIDGEPSRTTEYHYVNNDEYNDMLGVVITVGATIFGR